MGGDVDEYASVPEYHGELPPGDVVALGANPTVVARLTGADARARARRRAHGCNARGSPAALELVRDIAELMGMSRPTTAGRS